MSSLSERKTIKFDQGWDIMQKGITNLIRILEAPLPEQQKITSEEYMMLYTTIYNMCRQKPDYSPQLYDKYGEVFKAYITSTVLPALRETHDEFMLRELVKRWINHKVMVRWLSRIFDPLNYYFIPLRLLPELQEVGLACFRDLIYKEEINVKVKDAVISLIDQERQGEQIDRALLKNIFDIFVEIELDFEAAMLTDTAASYYSHQKKNWIIEDSCPKKAEDCLKKEKDRVEPFTSEGTSLVKQAEDAASNKKELGLHEQSL